MVKSWTGPGPVPREMGSAIIGDPQTWFFQNPHPPLKEGDRIKVTNCDPHPPSGWDIDGTPGTVLSYQTTSPRLGDQYNVQLDGYAHPITFPLRMLELVKP